MASLSIELCAYSVAIALVCRPNPTTSRQWSIGSLCDELKCFEHYENHNFRFNQLALHQGLSLFKKTIELFGCSVIILGAKGNECIKAFMDLPDKSRGAEIIFNTGPLCDHTSRDCLVTEILKTTNALLTRTCKAVSQYNSISQIYGVLWLDQMSDVEEVTSHNKRRKKGVEIGYKQMDRYGKQVYEYVSSRICAVDESPTVYINAAMKESASRSVGDLVAVRRNIFDNDDNSDILSVSDVFAHPTVKDALKKFPNKNVTYKLHEVQMVIVLFDAIHTARIELEGEKYVIDNLATATILKNILSKYTRYSELVVESVIRWVKGRDVVRKVSGRKISVEFEADVWGKLMICEFERRMVRCSVSIFRFQLIDSITHLCFIFLPP